MTHTHTHTHTLIALRKGLNRLNVSNYKRKKASLRVQRVLILCWPNTEQRIGGAELVSDKLEIQHRAASDQVQYSDNTNITKDSNSVNLFEVYFQWNDSENIWSFWNTPIPLFKIANAALPDDKQPKPQPCSRPQHPNEEGTPHTFTPPQAMLNAQTPEQNRNWSKCSILRKHSD